MAEAETKHHLKNVPDAVPEEMEKLNVDASIDDSMKVKTKEEMRQQEEQNRLDAWAPKTQTGRDVKHGKETDIDKILADKKKILEPEIVDSLIKVESDLISIGQAKGKFGGGKRRAWRQTQRKTMEGNVVTFSAMAVVGDKNGHVGVGTGKAKETLPAREKAIRQAKLSIAKVERGCGNFDCTCNELHTVPFIVEGKCGSVRVKLLPAAQGTGLVVGDDLKKILRLAGIKDVYGVTSGNTRTTFNAVKACFEALKNTRKVRK